MNIEETLRSLADSGNMRSIPSERRHGIVDMTSNDYLGLADDVNLRQQFLDMTPAQELLMTSSASRLLAGHQSSYVELEKTIGDSYGRKALLFNSGYHANTGIIQALAGKSTLIVADRLVHASIIDGIKLSGAPFERFRHNDYVHLERILATKASNYSDVLVIVESVYSMDGDKADMLALADIKKRYPSVTLYVDEAHGVGVLGPAGLGLAAATGTLDSVDILVGTFGKALASTGAYAIVSDAMRSYLINKARSLIFSTVIAPATARWSLLTWRAAVEADTLRVRLDYLAKVLARIIPGGEPSHIRPLIVGDAAKAVELSRNLSECGYAVLPIRTPTVPPGTERLRFSLSASISNKDMAGLWEILNRFGL